MTEPSQPQAGGRPSEDEIREYVQQLRAAPVDQVLSEVLISLLNAAQAKLGRRDARLLIDVSATVFDHTRRYLPDELTGQFDQILGQLRLGQVQSESSVAARAEPEPNDLAEAPPPPAGGTAQSAAASSVPLSRATTPPQSEPPPKLWVPGRDF